MRTENVTISGTVEFEGNEYDYTAILRDPCNDACPSEVTDIDCADGSPIPVSVDFEALEELAMENASLLDWCQQEGWQVDRSVEGRTALIRAPDGVIQRVTNIGGLAEPQTMGEPIVFGLYNWSDQLVGETQTFVGGFDEWIASGDYEARPAIKEPEPVLKDGVIYSADNGMLICKKCAGQSALYTGRDISGQKVSVVPRSENSAWKKMFGENMACEKGCTRYGEL